MRSIIFISFIFALASSDGHAYKGGRTTPPLCKSNSKQVYNIQSDVPCKSAPVPSCSYGVCGAAVCTASDGWCTENYVPMPESIGFISTAKFPGKKVKLVQGFGFSSNRAHFIAKYTDQDSRNYPLPTGGSYSVTGGETICDIGMLDSQNKNAVQDEVLTFVEVFDRPLFASCSYFKPNGGTCCTSWTPPSCCPPPPPPTIFTSEGKNNGG